MKKNRFTTLAAFTAMALLCCSVVISISVARGQCPASTWPASDPCSPSAWGLVSKGPVPLVGTTCYVTYTMCIRYCTNYSGEYQEDILESVTPVPGCAGCNATGLSPDVIIKDLLHQIETACICGDGGPPPPQCGSSTTEYQVTYAMDCREGGIDGNGNQYYFACGNSSDYCTTTCQICQKGYNGPFIITSCSSTSHDDGACIALPSPDLWVNGICYDVAPCGTPK